MLARVPATWLPGLRALLESRGGVAKWWHRVQSTMEEELGDLWGEVEGVEGAPFAQLRRELEALGPGPLRVDLVPAHDTDLWEKKTRSP